MQRPKSKPTDRQRDAWAAALQVALITSDRPAGEGWKTLRELAQERRLTTQTMGHHVHRAYQAGRLERAQGYVGPTRVPTFFYRPVAA